MNKLQDSFKSLSVSTDRLIELKIKCIENYTEFNDRIYMNAYDMKRYKLSALDFILLNDSQLYRCWPDLDCKVEGTAILNKGITGLASCKLLRQQELNNLPLARSISILTDPLKNESNELICSYVHEYLLENGFVFVNQQFTIDCPGRLSIKVTIDEIDSGKSTNYFNVKPVTNISLKMPVESKPKEKIELGGLEKQIEQIVELITLPDKLKSCNISINTHTLSPPKGILLYGPPGTGKTLLAKKIALDLGYSFFPIDGSDISSKFYGESEEKLKKVFQDASASSPSIIFIDELDCLCPKREESQSSIERRIIACLLTLMDGINSKESTTTYREKQDSNPNDSNNNLPSIGKCEVSPIERRIFVIAATNRPDSLDRALRRPGRFDKEIEIPIPNAKERSDILKTIIWSSFPQKNLQVTEGDIEFIAERAHGYVGADLAALCRESLLHCAASSNESITDDLSSISFVQTNICLRNQDLLYGLTVVKPSAMREITAQIPSTHWDDIGGQHEIKRALKECIEWPLIHREAFQRMGIEPPKGVLLYGPPGCSKTLMAKALATEAKLNFIPVKGPELFNKWFGESEKAVKEVFRKARAASPSIIFFDEIDAIGTKRDSSGTGESSVQDRVLSMLLNEMDGIEPLVNVTIVGATNRPDAMDPALLRPGRFDRLIYVSPPDSDARAEIFRIQSRDMPFSKQIDLEQLVVKSDGYSGAEIVSLCQEAAIHALAVNIQAAQIEMTDFDVAFTKVRKGITPEMISFYKQFQNK